MHNLRINNYIKPKIMINSQDVYFDITRQCAQVELKNINIFSKNNPLGSSCANGKEFNKRRVVELSQDEPPWDPPSGVFRLARWVSSLFGRSTTIYAFLSFVTQVYCLILPGNVMFLVRG
jgi:hypothetical protein